MVERVVVVCSITVILAITEVVFVIVGNHIRKRKPVVGRDEVQRCERSALRCKGVGRASKPGRKPPNTAVGAASLACSPNVSESEITHSIPVAVVPLHEAQRKMSGLPTTHSNVPRLNDEGEIAQHRIVEDAA